MADPRILGATLQTVHRGAQASTDRVLYTAALAVHRGSQGTTDRIAAATAQTVIASISQRVRAAMSFALVIHRGTGGAVSRESFAAAQIIYRTGAADNSRQRAWTFDFDGHTFYVLDLGPAGSLLFDLTTSQWTRFETAGYGGHWDFKNGFHWRTGQMVVGGQAGTAIVHRIDTTSFLDEGWRPVEYEVRGALPTGGVGYHRQYSLRLLGAAGQTADTVAPVLNMQFSDDQGVTWSAVHSITLTQNTSQRIEFRSLGAFTAPGRIFRLYDTGGIKFIAYVEADIGGADANTSS